MRAVVGVLCLLAARAENERVVAWAKQRRGDAEYLVVIFVNEAYVDVLVNQFVAMVRFDDALPSRVGTVCVDRASIESLREIGAPECFAPETVEEFASARRGVNKAALWHFRLRVLSALAHAGVSVILTDADAIWQRDPRPDLAALKPTNVLAQRGKYPLFEFNKWGATLCMGFAVFNASLPGTALFLRAVQAAVAKSGDDQMAANEVLDHVFHLRWNSTLEYKDGVSYDRGIGAFNDTALSVVLLPEMTYVRYDCESKDNRIKLKDAIVVHCQTVVKQAYTKLHEFHNTGVLYIAANNNEPVWHHEAWHNLLRDRLVHHPGPTFADKLRDLLPASLRPRR